MKLPFDTDQGIGTRATLGIVVLETDETLEHEFARIMDIPGVALHATRIPMVTDIHPETLARMEADLPAATRLLPSAPTYEAVGYGCTSGATVIGPDGVRDAVQQVIPDVPVTDPLSAIIAGARALGAQRLGFLTPYLPQVSAQMRARLEDAGFSIAGFGSFEESDDRVVARITPTTILSAVETIVAQAPCDAIVVSCTNLRVLDVIAQAEARTGVAILSSNQALAWHMLRLSGLPAEAENRHTEYGRLFTL